MASIDSRTMIDIERIRKEFPILSRKAKSGDLIAYLDSAATSQRPFAVIKAMSRFYETQNANIHRGIHQLAEEATQAYEQARARVAKFIGARSSSEIVFTRNTTESINLVAHSWGRTQLHEGDRILLTEMEHHSNLVPWQMLANERNIQLEFAPVSDDGRLDLEAYKELLKLEPRLVGFTHMSNVTGAINPVAEMTALAHQAGALVLIDGAQSVPHFPVDVGTIGADFLAFSAHKMCGPTGIGVLYAREALLRAMPPFLGGGDMIRKVQLRSFTPNDIPYKFEAGTPAIAEAIGLGAAIEFLEDIGFENVYEHERSLVSYALDRLGEIPGMRILGPGTDERGGVISFAMSEAHPHDIAQILDSMGIAVRAGHHCAMPLHERFNLPASTRASFYLYTTLQEIDRLIAGIYRVKEIFE
jgi:cysteine desulfurase/selenocysteine lyase